MAGPVLNDVLQLTFRCQAADQAGINVRHWKVTSVAGTGAQWEAIALGFWNDISDILRPIVSTKANLINCGVKRVFPLPASDEWLSQNDPIAGDSGAELLPRQVSGLITLRTGLAGRANRGRVYLPFPAESDSIAEGHPTVAYVLVASGVANFYAAPVTYGAGGNTTTLTPVIYHVKTRTTTPITSGIARPRWATQRRRGDYGRPNVL